MSQIRGPPPLPALPPVDDEANETLNRCGELPGTSAVILVGHGIGERSHSDEPIAPRLLFTKIDAVLVRRREMRGS